MSFTVERKIEICRQNNDRPGCCWYLCDNPKKSSCKNCYSCYSNCPHDVYEVINDEPLPIHQENCVGCKICEEMCPTHAIYVRPLVDEGRGVWSNSTMVEIKRKSQTGSYKVRGCGLTRKIPTFDDLSILPAQVSRPPIDSYREACKTSVVLGDRFAENPIEIDTPIMIGAMSFGALSKEAKIALAIGSSKVGSISNTGEGGMLPEERHYADKLIAQYASGRFGVSASYLNNAEAVEIKIGQGAKSHMDIVGPEDLGMKINQLREITDWKIPIIVKFASGRVEQDVKIAAKAGADIIVVDGMQGGTGAGPEVVTEHAGIPTIEAIVKADDALKDINLRNDVSLIAAGGIRSGADVAKAIALGADAVYIATSALISVGCKVCQSCSEGICPKGIATQDRVLRRRLDPVRKGQQVANYIEAMTQEVTSLTQQAGNTDIENLERQDLVALTMEASQLTGVPMVRN